jgi:hypothetical protein
MLHALGITHVVSVGECALVPPSGTSATNALSSSSCSVQPSPNAHLVVGKGPGGQGSLWIEEREGRIKVLDIKGICDDGIDTLEPQLEPICDWIEKARAEGGQVLVHCRVGVSRSATVTVREQCAFDMIDVIYFHTDRIRDEAFEFTARRSVPDRAVASSVGVDPTQHEAIV